MMRWVEIGLRGRRERVHATVAKIAVAAHWGGEERMRRVGGERVKVAHGWIMLMELRREVPRKRELRGRRVWMLMGVVLAK